MIPFFKNTDIDVYTYNGLDKYGDKIYSHKFTIEAGDMQQLSNEDSMEIFGKILQDTYQLYLDDDTSINDTAHLRIQGECYKVVGSVENWNHLLNYQRIVLQKLREGQ